ncbi:MAG: prepilin-type N-terminal cleavage/methylation domain-containing protein [Planctomycetes bacterium]|nr:prepilin-type N-terminal cleavage/methylation domain-containing protein [Planctomycetota bacterium]
MRCRPRPPAFTLIEMLIVIAIIAVLAALLAPALQKSLDVAREAACANNLRQVGIATSTYLADYHNRFFRAGELVHPNTVVDGWYSLVYQDGGNIYFCPADQMAEYATVEDRLKHGQISYGVNDILCGGMKMKGWGAPFDTPLRLRDAKRPSKTIGFTDTVCGIGWNPPKLYGYFHVFPYSDIYNPMAHTRHMDLDCNVLWLDWHVQKVSTPAGPEALYAKGLLGKWWGCPGEYNYWDPFGQEHW